MGAMYRPIPGELARKVELAERLDATERESEALAAKVKADLSDPNRKSEGLKQIEAAERVSAEIAEQREHERLNPPTFQEWTGTMVSRGGTSGAGAGNATGGNGRTPPGGVGMGFGPGGGMDPWSEEQTKRRAEVLEKARAAERREQANLERVDFIRDAAIALYAQAFTTQATPMATEAAWTAARRLWDCKPEDC